MKLSNPRGGAFGFGVEGFRDRIQVSDKEFSFYPAVPSKSKFSPDFMAK